MHHMRMMIIALIIALSLAIQPCAAEKPCTPLGEDVHVLIFQVVKDESIAWIVFKVRMPRILVYGVSHEISWSIEKKGDWRELDLTIKGFALSLGEVTWTYDVSDEGVSYLEGKGWFNLTHTTLGLRQGLMGNDKITVTIMTTAGDLTGVIPVEVRTPPINLFLYPKVLVKVDPMARKINVTLVMKVMCVAYKVEGIPIEILRFDNIRFQVKSKQFPLPLYEHSIGSLGYNTSITLVVPLDVKELEYYGDVDITIKAEGQTPWKYVTTVERTFSFRVKRFWKLMVSPLKIKAVKGMTIPLRVMIDGEALVVVMYKDVQLVSAKINREGTIRVPVVGNGTIQIIAQEDADHYTTIVLAEMLAIVPKKVQVEASIVNNKVRVRVMPWLGGSIGLSIRKEGKVISTVSLMPERVETRVEKYCYEIAYAEYPPGTTTLKDVLKPGVYDVVVFYMGGGSVVEVEIEAPPPVYITPERLALVVVLTVVAIAAIVTLYLRRRRRTRAPRRV
ncbi:MAG: hypothetical protein DRN15_01450 [Thermoprotei archaeon]|nr:MAG: hypothetical protein DRN15_01450 [Thermoprotei archaeon]RLF25860.1 MAG: hypothetical protein DRM97_00345 [Thermoprotei archaeon]